MLSILSSQQNFKSFEYAACQLEFRRLQIFKIITVYVNPPLVFAPNFVSYNAMPLWFYRLATKNLR